jgi:hypothetical protein
VCSNTIMINDYFQYLDLPNIPNELIELDLKQLETRDNIFIEPNYPFYKQYPVDDKLSEYLKSIIVDSFFASYQVIRKGIAVHKDINRTECLNYILDTGGDDSRLSMYDDDTTTVLYSGHVEPLKWHRINVSKFHGVSGLTRPRISISVTTKK